MDVTGLTAADLKGRTPDELEAIAGAVDDELRDSFTVDGAVRNLSDGEHSEFTRLIDVRDAALKRAERSRAIEAVWRAHPNAVESASFPGPESRDRDRDGDSWLHPQARQARDEAFRAVESLTNADRMQTQAADSLDEMLRERDRTGLGAQYVAACADRNYLSAFGKMLKDPTTGHLRFSHAEADAVRRVAEIQELRAMNEGTTTAGGFAVPAALDPSILHSSSGAINPLRSLARIVQVVNSNQWKGISADAPTASYDQEASEVSDDSPTVAQPAATIFAGRAFVPFSLELEADWGGYAGGELQAELTSLLQQSRDILDASKFLTGSGSNEPVGIFAIGTTGALTTTQRTLTNATAATAVADVYSLKQAVMSTVFGQGATWVAHPTIVDVIYRFVANASSSEPDLMPAGRGGDLLGLPVAEMTTMQSGNTTTGHKVAALGNWAKGLAIVDRLGTSVEIVPHLFGGSSRPTGQRGLFMWWRTGTVVQVPNALRYLEVK